MRRHSGRLAPFEPNEYRKRVLAAVAARGGPETSDPFELYDLPLADAERLRDPEVAERVDAVWGFWQRQRDHPKYRVLAAALVAEHGRRSAEVLDSRARAATAARVRAEREGRDAARFELIDAAARRLVQRHGGIPREKLPALAELGISNGLTVEAVAGRLRQHRIIDVAAAEPAAAVSGPALSPERRRAVRSLLDELGRIWDSPPPVTLLDLLGVAPEAIARPHEIRAAAAAWRARAREIPPTRQRAVVDELLVHVHDLLEAGGPAAGAYLDAVAEDVAERLLPQARAAVLVEDRLTAEDFAELAARARALGLDAGRARALVVGLAQTLGAPYDAGPADVSSSSHAGPRAQRPPRPSRPTTPTRSTQPPPAARPSGSGRDWEAPLRAARAALRAGRVDEARRHLDEARRAAGADWQPSIGAVADEIATQGAHAARNPTPHPAPAPPPAPAPAAPAPSAPAPAVPPPAAARAPSPGLAAPSRVRAERLPDGTVAVRWRAVPSDASAAAAPVEYKVSRIAADGSSRVVGRTRAAVIEDGGAGPGPGVPAYAVVAVYGSGVSVEARSAPATG